MDKITPACPCKRKSCKRFGNCGECRRHHENKKYPVYCERPEKIQKREKEEK